MEEQALKPQPAAATSPAPSTTPALVVIDGGASPAKGPPAAGPAASVSQNQGIDLLRLLAMARRHIADGTVYRRKDRRWAAEISGGAGRRRQVRYARSRGEAMQLLADLRRTLDPSHGITKNTSLADFLAVWLDVVMRPTIKQSTYMVFGRIIRNTIEPHIGAVTLKSLTTERLQSFVGALHEAEVSAHRQRQAVALLCLALGHAATWGILNKNHARKVKVPKRPTPPIGYLQLDEIGRFLTEANKSRLFALYAVLLTTGARRGEVAALRYRDVDFGKGQIHIGRSLAELTGGVVFLEPKTPHSRRTIDLPQYAVEALREHRNRMLDEGRDTSGDALVFVSCRGTPLAMGNVVRWSLRPILRAAGLKPLTLHGLRHTHATWLLRLGVSPKVVAERLGHASAETTLAIYAQALTGDQNLAVEALEKLFPSRRGNHG